MEKKKSMTHKHICYLLSFQGSLAAILPFVKKNLFTVENNLFSYSLEYLENSTSAAQRQHKEVSCLYPGIVVKAAGWGGG